MNKNELPELANKIRAEAKALTPDCTAFLQDLIRVPAESCVEGDRVARIKQEMESIGFDSVEVDELGSIVGHLGSGDTTSIAIDEHQTAYVTANEKLYAIGSPAR